jgi:hypothetical protein
LLKAGSECDKKILVLTDAHLNRGITEPDRIEALTRSGLGKDAIRTGCLGFGDSYNEEIEDQGQPFTYDSRVFFRIRMTLEMKSTFTSHAA